MTVSRWQLAAGASTLSFFLMAPTLAVGAPPATTSVDLAGDTQVDDLRVAELSGLAWSADDELLYAVSDLGYVVQLKIQVDGDTLLAVKPVRAFKLSDAKDVVAGAGKRFNAEGLALRGATDGKPGNTELVVAVEENPPLIVRFDPDGAALGMLDVPAPANDIDNYRKKGRGLESVAFSAEHGLMTAPESPLLDAPSDWHTVYADGQQWSFTRHEEDSRLKAFDVLPDNQLLVLERTRHGSKKEQSASLRRVDLSDCDDGGLCKAKTLAELPTGPHNFEGMALLTPDQALLVSDNSGKASGDTRFTLVSLP